jgi:uncharacterized iron-regulated protein
MYIIFFFSFFLNSCVSSVIVKYFSCHGKPDQQTENGYGVGEYFSGCQLPTHYQVGAQFAKMKLDMKAESVVEMPGRHDTTQHVAKEVLIQRIKLNLNIHCT